MIKINGLSKNYNSKEILEEVNIDISSPGLYVICGESGCGKSTLINIIGLMDDEFDGEFYFFNKEVNEMNVKIKELIRYNQISYIYQIPKLLENESVYNNILVATNKKIQKKKLTNELRKFNLKVSLNKVVSKLSGGERKRLSILIALLKDAPLLLCDEVTVGLDEENKKLVLDLLIKHAKRKVILLVTHDISFVSKYTKNIFYIKNKKIDIKTKKGEIQEKSIKKNNRLKSSFLITHIINHFSKNQVRTFICSSSLIVALVCLGFCILLTSSVSSSIISSLGSTLGENQIVMSSKKEDYLLDEKIIINDSDMDKIKSKYGIYFSYQSVRYQNDFSTFFKDQESVFLEVNNQNIYLKKYGINEINNFHYFSEDDEFIYTQNYDLQEDEVIISLTPNQVYSFTRMLNIEYINESSLMKYFENNNFILNISLLNLDWEYQIDISLKVVGYVVDDKPSFYHTDSLWNEYIIQHILQLPDSSDLNKIDDIPWMVKKIKYFSLIKNKEHIFLNEIIKDEFMEGYEYFIFKEKDIFNIYFTYSHLKKIKDQKINEILINESFDSYLPCYNTGFSVVKEAMVYGVTYPCYISNEYQLLEDYIDYNSYSSQNLGMYQSTIFSTNEKMLSLNVLDTTKSNYIKINTYNEENEKIIGSYPKKYNDIIISSSLLSKLNLDMNNRDFSKKPLYLLILKDIEYANGKYRNNFIVEKIYISGIIENETEFIYVNSYWAKIFFSLVLEQSSNEFLTENVIFSSSNIVTNESIKELNEKYANYTFSNPYIDYRDKVNDTIYFVRIGLIIFCAFCIISSLLMMIVCSYLFVSDMKKEIGIYTFLGYTRKSIERQFKLISNLLSLYSSIVSCFSLFLIVSFFNYENLSEMTFLSSDLIISMIIIFVLSLIVGNVSSFFSTRKILKESPIKQLKEN